MLTLPIIRRSSLDAVIMPGALSVKEHFSSISSFFDSRHAAFHRVPVRIAVGKANKLVADAAALASESPQVIEAEIHLKLVVIDGLLLFD